MRRPGGFALCLLLLLGGFSWLLSQDPRPAGEAPRAGAQAPGADAAVMCVAAGDACEQVGTPCCDVLFCDVNAMGNYVCQGFGG